MSGYVINEDLFARLETVRGLASLQAWIFEEIEDTPGGRGLPGIEISALGQAMHHLLTQALDSAQFSVDVAED